MTENKFQPIHADREFFRESVLFTAKELGFPTGIVEKDYYCSLILMRVYGDANEAVIFKGGTCLSKCHTDFFRLSEDLDFMIPMPSDAPRSKRSKAMKGVKERWKKEICLPPFTEKTALSGHNNSFQYIGELEYGSVLGEMTGTIKFEIGLREELLRPVESINAGTVLLNPINNKRLLPPFPVKSFSIAEAYAEKMRAALTRREPAIRDFFDLDYADRILKFDLHDGNYLQLVRSKLAVPGNDKVDLSETRLDSLRKQIAGALKPVLRERDLHEFDLDRIFGILLGINKEFGKGPPS
ncbi:MAG: nucleotidyl transferase AbiEii/AbiGii toxin family protein [Victivallales bacterium]